jgi:hypothetical protein
MSGAMRHMRRDILKNVGIKGRIVGKIVSASTEEVDRARDRRKHPEKYCDKCGRELKQGEVFTQIVDEKFCPDCEVKECAKKQQTIPIKESPSTCESEIHHAPNDESDPIHQAKDGKWWFSDEIWSDCIGPFDTKQLAIIKCDEYMKDLMKEERVNSEFEQQSGRNL